MGYGDQIVYREARVGLLSTGGTSGPVAPIPKPFFEAIVVHVIVNHHSEGYGDDGYNVGAIKARIFEQNHGADDSNLPFIDPLDPTIKQLPLVGELVLIHEIQGNKYYSRIVPLDRRIQENAMIGLNNQLSDRVSKTQQKALRSGEEISPVAHKFGKYFKPDKRIRQLIHFEGDTIIEGRMGHSIRFGSSQMDPSSDGLAPSIILRTGQAKGVENLNTTRTGSFGLTIEDINLDASSIWMVSDQKIPFKPATTNAGMFLKSVKNKPQHFNKAQIIINSDRVVLNAKNTHVMLFAREGIHLNSFKDTTIDTDSNIILSAVEKINLKSTGDIESTTDNRFIINAGTNMLSTVMEKTSFISKNIYIGSLQNDAEPMVGGTSLSKFLARLILALVNSTVATPPTSFSSGKNASAHVITPMGNGALSPAVVSALGALYAELILPNAGQRNNKSSFSGASFNSTTNFVMLKNEEPKVIKNQFITGSQIPVTSSEWVITEDYYGISE